MQHNYYSGQSRNNHKTMRISDKSLQFILSFEGNTFNDQINNMIDYFINAKSCYEADLRLIEQQIEDKKKLLTVLQSKGYELSNYINDLLIIARNLKY